MNHRNLPLPCVLAALFTIAAALSYALPTRAQDGTAGPPASPAKTRIVLAGDSTVTDHAGWGVGFARCLGAGVQCINMSHGGRSSKSFIDEGLWQKCLDAKPDYVLIQFGHNDEPGKGPERETDLAAYRQFMTRYVDEARAAGIQPVLVTSLSRRQWGKDGKIHSSLAPRAEIVREIAKEKNVPVVDLHTASIQLYEKLGREGCLEFSPKKDDGSWDHTHLNAKGSEVFGQIVAHQLGRVVPELAPSSHAPAH